MYIFNFCFSHNLKRVNLKNVMKILVAVGISLCCILGYHLENNLRKSTEEDMKNMKQSYPLGRDRGFV